MPLNERTASALDDLIAARYPGLGDIGRLCLKCMVMDVLYFAATTAYAHEHPDIIPFFQAQAGELAARTQIIMDTNGIAKDRQKEWGKAAKEMAPVLQEMFAARVLMPAHPISH